MAIVRKFIDIKWYETLYPFLDGITPIETIKTNAVILIASQRVNAISGGIINQKLRDGTLDLSNDDNEQTYAVKYSTALYTQFILKNGYDFFMGSSSSNLGAASASVSPQLQQSILLLEQTISELLENSDIFAITSYGQISFKPTNENPPTPTPPPAGNWDPQKQFETYGSQFINSTTISVQFNPATQQVEWRFIGTIPVEWNATKQYEALKNQLVAGLNLTITHNDENQTLTLNAEGGGGSDVFATGQRVPNVRIDDTTPSSLQTKAVVEGKVANKLDRTFANAILPSAFNNKGLKWTGTTFEPQAFGETPTRYNTWEIFKEVFKPDISHAAGCITVDEAKKTLSYRPCINQLETQIQEIQNALQGVSFTPPTGKKYLAVGVGNLLTYETAIQAVTPTNTYPVMKEIVHAGTNLTFRWQDDIHIWTINVDDTRFADNSVVSDYAPIGDGTQLVAMNQFDETATGKFLKKIDQGWEWSETPPVSDTFKTGQKLSETSIGNTNDNDLQTKANVVAKINPLTTDIHALQTEKLNKNQPTYQQGQIATLDANKNVVFKDATSIIPPDFWLSNISRENFVNIVFQSDLGKTYENQANDFIVGAPLELKPKTMTYKDIPNVTFTPSDLKVVGGTYLSFTCNVNAPEITTARVGNPPSNRLAFNHDYHFVVQAPYLPDLELTASNWNAHTTTIGGTLEVLHPITTIRADTVHNFAKYNSVIFPPTLHYFENGVTGIFENHKGLTIIVIPHNVRYIGNRCFYNSSVSSVSFSNGLGGEKSICDRIGSNAFNSCNRLTRITFPAKLKSIGDVAFYAVVLKRVEFLGTPPSNPRDFVVGQAAFHNTPISAIQGNQAAAWRRYMQTHYLTAWEG